ncbi:MAG: L,D-transpeptidase [Verrucomicrobiae bacterium]|nr:L,D-transpeptidase [Verrucomicrobiae bacterium]
MPILQKVSAQRRNRAGDLLAVLLLLAILAGLGWLWWHEKHPPKTARARPVIPAKVAVQAVQPVAPAKPKPLVVAAQAPADFPRPVRDVFEAQVALMRRAISPGSLDAAIGSQTRAALAAFQRVQKLSGSGLLDTNTRAVLTLDAPLLTTYTVTSNDLERLQPIGKTWLEKSQQSALDYETIRELVAEHAHAHPLLIEKLNPGVNWTNVAVGTVLKVPESEYPEPADKAAFVVIHLAAKNLEAFDAATNLILHCPCSIAAKVEKRPVGELHVAVIAPNPNYTFDPEVFPESPEAQAIGHKLILPPGPNNPVGLAWIGLDKPGYGMHGTPGPEQVGRTESHGCFRLANWDATYLVKLVWIGMPVEVVP